MSVFRPDSYREKEKNVSKCGESAIWKVGKGIGLYISFDKFLVLKMDKEQQDYILRYSSHLMTKDEKIAWRHYSTHYKHEIAFDKENPRYKLYLRKGWITENMRILKLLDGGIEDFREKTAVRILKESGSEIVFNYCPKCNKLTRTPFMKTMLALFS